MRPGRTLLTALTAVFAALALAATAAAARKPAPLLVGGPLKVKGYTLTLQVAKVTARGGKPVSLVVFLEKEIGQARQLHVYTFGLPASAYKTTGGTLQLDTKDALGKYGTIVLTFAGASSNQLPAGCEGSSVSTLKGTLSGRPGKPGLKLKLDDTFFGTVERRSLPAFALSANGVTCGTTDTDPAKGLVLSGTALVDDEILSFSATKGEDGKVLQDFGVVEPSARTAPAAINHSAHVLTDGSTVVAADDLSSATVTAAGPFVSGTVSYAAVTPIADGGTTGLLTGQVTATFDSIGARSVGATATIAALTRT